MIRRGDGVRAPRLSAPTSPSVARAIGGVILVGAVAIPVLLLALWSASGEWFYPALVPSTWSLESWTTLLHGGPLWRGMIDSVGLGLAVGIAGCAIAVPIGRTMARASNRWRPVVLAAALLPAAAPPIAVATGLQLSFITIGLAGSIVGVGLAHLVPAIGILSYFFCAVFTAYDPRLDEEARSLGATARDTWMRVTLPVLRPELLAGVTLGFIVSWGQVPLTLIIGGGAVHTLSVDVFAYAAAGEQRFAAAGALLLIIPVAAILALLRVAPSRASG